MISGDWIAGSVFTDPDTKKTTDDRENKARFFEHQIIDTAKTTKKEKFYRKIVKCDIRTPKGRDVFSALVKENSEKHLELTSRFPNAWKDFVSKGGGFVDKKEFTPQETIEKMKECKKKLDEADIEKVKEEKPIDLVAKMREEYNALADKRCKRAFEIRAEFKKADIKLEG